MINKMNRESKIRSYYVTNVTKCYQFTALRLIEKVIFIFAHDYNLVAVGHIGHTFFANRYNFDDFRQIKSYFDQNPPKLCQPLIFSRNEAFLGGFHPKNEKGEVLITTQPSFSFFKNNKFQSLILVIPVGLKDIKEASKKFKSRLQKTIYHHTFNEMKTKTQPFMVYNSLKFTSDAPTIHHNIKNNKITHTFNDLDQYLRGYYER